MDSPRTLDGALLKAFMEIWDRLAQGDRDNLAKASDLFDDAATQQREVGYYDGYATAARDVISYLRQGRFDIGATPPRLQSTDPSLSPEVGET